MNRPRLTLMEFSYLTPEEPGGSGAYRTLCKLAQLSPVPEGYGFAHCLDENGQRWTAITDDLAWWRLVIESGRLVRDVTIDGTERPARQHDSAISDDVLRRKFTQYRAGWPDQWW